MPSLAYTFLDDEHNKPKQRATQSLLLSGALLLISSAVMFRFFVHQDGAAPAFDATLPRWADYGAISSKTPKLGNNIAPVWIWHLSELRMPPPYRQVHLISAFTDSRPLLYGGRRAVNLNALVDTSSSTFSFQQAYPSDQVKCYLLARDHYGQLLTAKSSASIISAGDPYWHPIPYQVMINCNWDEAEELAYGSFDWSRAEVFATVSASAVDPPHDVYVRARTTPELDAVNHKTGIGLSAVCLAPLRGDVYAPFMKDFLSYYRTLGFRKFYVYLLDPGPITLSILREVLAQDQAVVPIRWAIPKAWFADDKESGMPRASEGYNVDPRLWGLTTLDALSEQGESKLGMQSDDKNVNPWYFGQVLAAQDCLGRARADGARWVASLDWDEYIALSPPDGAWEPPLSASESRSAIISWGRRLPWIPPRVERFKVLQTGIGTLLGAEVDPDNSDLLPSAFMFRSAFAYLECQPSNPPMLRSLGTLKHGFPVPQNWTSPPATFPVPFASPVRDIQFFAPDSRSKKILDPWAWFLDETHNPHMSYAQFTLEFGGCSSTSRGLSARRECARAILSALGRSALEVTLPEDAKPGQSSGMMIHHRSQLSSELLNLTSNATDYSVGVCTSDKAIRLRSDLLHKCDNSAHVEDWSFLQIMEKSLYSVLYDRIKARE